MLRLQLNKFRRDRKDSKFVSSEKDSKNNALNIVFIKFKDDTLNSF